MQAIVSTMLRVNYRIIIFLILILPILLISSILFSWLKNILGGGDIQKSRIAIADLPLKKANVEVQRAGLERRYSEVQDQIRKNFFLNRKNYHRCGCVNLAADREFQYCCRRKLARYHSSVDSLLTWNLRGHQSRI